MHIYQPHEHDRVGWSPPQEKPAEQPSPSKLWTAVAMIGLTLFGLGVMLAYFTLGLL